MYSSGYTVVSSLQSRKEVSDALHVIIWHHPLPLRAAALLVGLGVRHSADPREREQGLEAAVGAQHDVCVKAVAHHQAALAFHAELGGHAVKHEVVGFAYCLGLALGCCLDGLQQAACTWEEEEAEEERRRGGGGGGGEEEEAEEERRRRGGGLTNFCSCIVVGSSM